MRPQLLAKGLANEVLLCRQIVRKRCNRRLVQPAAAVGLRRPSSSSIPRHHDLLGNAVAKVAT